MKKLFFVLSSVLLLVASSCSKDAVSELAINDPYIINGNLETYVGVIHQVGISVKPVSSAQYLAWTSSNEAVATVKEGYVQTLSAGVSTITVSSSNGKHAEFNVIVSQRELTKWTCPSSLEMCPGSFASFDIEVTEAVGMDEDNKELFTAGNLDFELTGTNADVFRYSVEGNTVTVNCAGDREHTYSATLKMTNSTGKVSKSVALTAIYRTVTAVSVSPSSVAELFIGSTTTLTATVSPSNATEGSLEWSVENDCATIVANGNKCTVTGVKAGQVKVTATARDNGKSATSTINVVAPYATALNVSISDDITSFSRPILCVGDKNKSYVSVAIAPGDFPYEIVNNSPSIIDIDKNGNITNVKSTGVASITVKAAGKTDYISQTLKILAVGPASSYSLGRYSVKDTNLNIYKGTTSSTLYVVPGNWTNMNLVIDGYVMTKEMIQVLSNAYGTGNPSNDFKWTKSGSNYSEHSANATSVHVQTVEINALASSAVLKLSTPMKVTPSVTVTAKVGSFSFHSVYSSLNLGTRASTGKVVNNGGTLALTKSVAASKNVEFSLNPQTAYDDYGSAYYATGVTFVCDSSAISVYNNSEYSFTISSSASTGTYTVYCKEYPSIKFYVSVN